MNHKINYNIISDALEFYQKKGFQDIEVPWIVSEEAYSVTSPKDKQKIKSHLGYHVASAEQSFIELALHNELNNGKFVTCSPCYRDDESDGWHQKYFMKVELIDFSREKLPNSKEKLDGMISISKEFYDRYLETKVVKTDIGYDIFSKKQDIELGSYGIRDHINISWVYGTGVAEPRLSQVINLDEKSYHNGIIPEGIIGELSKIEEELNELKDSEKQGNKIMSLHEMSDLIGAMELYLEKNYNNTFNLNDLIKMKDATKRAFSSGCRK